MDKTYGEKIYGISYAIEPEDAVSTIKTNTAKLADSWSDMLAEYAEGDSEGEPVETMVKVDYIIRALEKLEEASFLAVKSQFI